MYNSNCLRLNSVWRICLLALGNLAVCASLLLGDGMPDALRLSDPADAGVFRRWFTFLAEAQLYNSGKRPTEIVDCSSLLRYAFREALRDHNGAWARQAELPLVPAIGSVKRYNFPHTPVGANLFRVRTGDFQLSDVTDGSFAAFADAKTLERLNTFFVSRDLHRALPGDLLFYRDKQNTNNLPQHDLCRPESV